MTNQNSPLQIVTNLVSAVLEQMNQHQSLSGPQRKFMAVLLPTLLTVRGRVNFLNMGRYCPYLTASARCGGSFAVISIGHVLTVSCYESQGALPKEGAKERAKEGSQEGSHGTVLLAQDASFIEKSGKKTPGLDYFFNGCAGRPQRGLEISLVSLIAVETNTAYTFSVRQTLATPPEEKKSTTKKQATTKTETRMDFYLAHLQQVRPELPSLVRYAVFDGGFAKRKFVTGVYALKLHLISKLRHDADLRYLYEGEQKTRGRRRLYDGKVRFTDLSRWEDAGAVVGEEDLQLYSVDAFHHSLGRVVRVGLLLNRRNPAKPRYVLLFSTDVTLSALEIYRYYAARFQMEFLFRDSKQWTGLCDSQARDAKALDFHFNAALSAVNLAKLAAQVAEQASEKTTEQTANHTTRAVFSLSSWKQYAFNEHLLETFITNLALEPSWVKSHPNYAALCQYGAIVT